jgi:Fe-S cluster assembly ATP-binding protein
MNEKIPLLEIKNLNVSIKEIQILKNLNLIINKGEIHAIMGRNGSGKSTLSKVIAGHPAYNILSGDILFNGKSILEIEPELRAHMGIFLAFQYPVEIPGVSNEDFLRLAYNSKYQYEGYNEINPIDFITLVNDKLKTVDMDPVFLTRNVNEGFSGGEKKKNEILQMSLLDSNLSILDETDSGLDIDALKIVSKGILQTLKNKEKSVVLITHYQRLLDYVKPNFIHIMHKGSIVKTGDATLAKKLELTGYDWLDDL